MTVMLRNPDAPATSKQLYRIKMLTGEDYSERGLTMQQASNLIGEWEGHVIPPPENMGEPFDEAHVTIIEADQGGGKSVTATGMVVDAYYNDCVRIWCEEKKIAGVVKGYDRKQRIARVKIDGETKYFKIPLDYKLHSPMRIFSNCHLYGIPYVYIPSFAHLLKWLRIGLIVNAWLLVDEAYVGANARDSMTAFGKALEKQGFQMRKMQLDVVIITPHAKLIDRWLRVVPTKHIIASCRKYRGKDGKKHWDVTLTIRKRGEKRSRTLPPYDATQYFPNYKTNERINK